MVLARVIEFSAGRAWPRAGFELVFASTGGRAISGLGTVEAAEPGENGYWLIWKGGDDSFTRTSPNLPRPQIVEPR